MTYRFRKIFMFSALVAGAAGGGLAVNACSSTTPVQATTDAAPTDATTAADVVDDHVGQFHDGIEGGGQWSPTVLMLNLKPQPSFIFNAPDAAADAAPSAPPFTIPFIQVTNNSGLRGPMPLRPPDAVVPSLLPDLGCIAYKFTSTDPRNPKGPGITDGDMGNVTVSGFAGGLTLPGPPGTPPDAPMAPQINCVRKEFFPGAGLFGYNCDQFPGPVTHYLSATDTITAQIEGGAAVPAWSASENPSKHLDEFNVATNLWMVPPSAVDGSGDLVINYDCGGMPCSPTSPNASVAAVVIQSTDARSSEDGGANDPLGPMGPFEFNPAKKEFGLILCKDFLGFNPSSFTVKKELLAQIPGSWTDLRIVVATAAAHQSSSSNDQHTVLAVGPAQFGISHR